MKNSIFLLSFHSWETDKAYYRCFIIDPAGLALKEISSGSTVDSAAGKLEQQQNHFLYTKYPNIHLSTEHIA